MPNPASQPARTPTAPIPAHRTEPVGAIQWQVTCASSENAAEVLLEFPLVKNEP